MAQSLRWEVLNLKCEWIDKKLFDIGAKNSTLYLLVSRYLNFFYVLTAL